MKQKRIAAIHDISGIGKCSLTVALPILSAAGCEAAVIPTAVLSTHTGGFENYTYRDLTDDMPKIAEHWNNYGFEFDAIYSGFLGSNEQVSIVCDIIKMLKNKSTVAVVDPAMADHGKLYKTFSSDFPQSIKKLVAMADILTPNITEACLLTDTPYKSGPYDKEYIENLLCKCAMLGCKTVVLTGVYFDNDKLGAAAYDCESKKTTYISTEKQDGFYHGTGDIFASVLTAAIMCEKTLEKAVEIAVEFVKLCIEHTAKYENPNEYGVYFEPMLPKLMEQLGIL